VYFALQANDGNIKRTARHTGVPIQTVRDWRNRWENGGVPDELLSTSLEIATEFVEQAERVRDKALNRLEEQIDANSLNGRELTTAVGVLTDKINISKGIATKRTETVHTLPNREQIIELFSGFTKGVVFAAHAREAEIIDAQVVEHSPRELPQTTEA